jgi:serine/threonine protein kinase
LRINIFGIQIEDRDEGISPEDEVLKRMIMYFGPVTLGLLEHVNDDQWCSAMIKLNSSFNIDNPARPFSLWDERGFPGLESDFKRLVGRMMALDPAERATVNELLEDPWWYTGIVDKIMGISPRLLSSFGNDQFLKTP